MYSIHPLLQSIWLKQSPWKAWLNCEYPIMAIKCYSACLTYQNTLLYYCNYLLEDCLCSLFRWFMPVNILLAFTFGLFFGWIVVKVTRAPAKLRGLILGCCSAGNQVYLSTFSLGLSVNLLQFVDKHSAQPSATLRLASPPLRFPLYQFLVFSIVRQCN
jgi:hypothetical protein